MIYDVSMWIEPSMQVYKNKAEKIPKFNTLATHEKNAAHETEITVSLHTGTHVDYPLHMLENGKTSTSEQLSKLIGSCKVIDFTHLEEKITKTDLLPQSIEKDDFILFKTKNSQTDDFDFNFVYLEESGATYLKNIGVRGVGIDALGIERAQKDHATHKILLGADIVIIEGLRLNLIQPGPYELICLPLKIKNVEASLARVLLKD